MYGFNKIALALVNPTTFGLALLAVGRLLPRRAVRRTLYALAALWFWFIATPMPGRWFGVALERLYPQRPAEAYEKADAIVLLGGGMGANTNGLVYAEMWSSADRAWFAGRLWRAGRAPKVFPSGLGCADSDVKFLEDYGVPSEAIVVDNSARNTEENVRFVREKILAERPTGGGAPRVLLVTSAWHMRRALLMCAKYAPDLSFVPAPADFEFTAGHAAPFGPGDLRPSAASLAATTLVFKEMLGYWGYRLFR